MTGIVATFYSYKGGVGRSFALANTAVILAQWGLRVLAVDWDIEAPGLSHYFEAYTTGPSPGVVNFLLDCRDGSPKAWDAYVQTVRIPECRGALSLMPAAHTASGDYTRIVQELNWDTLFSDRDLGAHLETVRQNWIDNFDVVLVDSRTGITDFSGITTIQLPDLLVFFFTANRQSLQGCCDVVRRAMAARGNLPLDRPALLPIPIPARFELREEYDRANTWRTEFATTLREFFDVWVPKTITPNVLVDNLLIPYVPRWSFGEELAALLEPAGTNGIRSASYPISFAIETLAALLANRLQRIDLFSVSRDEFVLTARAEANDTLGRRTNKKKKVFVSYLRQSDGGIIQDLVRELEAVGLDVWTDRKVTLGSKWDDEIRSNLDDSDALVVIVSENASKWQTQEIESFIRRGLRGQSERPIIPVVLPGAMSALGRNRFLSGFQAFQIRANLPLRLQASTLASQLIAILDPTTSNRMAEQRRREMLAHVELAARLKTSGDAIGAMRAYDAALHFVEGLSQTDRSNNAHSGDLADIHEKIGDLHNGNGDLTNALKRYEESLQVLRRAESQGHDGREWSHRISTLNAKVGDVLFARGDLLGAQMRLEESLAISRRLAVDSPEDDVLKRNIFSLSTRVGDVVAATGDLARAMETYNDALAISQQLNFDDPGHYEWQREISVLTGKIGDVLSAQGHLSSALEQYEKSLSISRLIASQHPEDRRVQRDLFVCLTNIGGTHRARGDLSNAQSCFQESLAVARRLVSADPGDAVLKRDLSLACNNVGDTFRSAGQFSEALSFYEESLGLFKWLAASDSDNTTFQRDLMMSYAKFADIQRIAGDLRGALESSQASVEVAERLTTADPANPAMLRELAMNYGGLASALERLGAIEESMKNYRRGQETFRRLLKFSADDPSLSRELSRFDESITRLEK